MELLLQAQNQIFKDEKKTDIYRAFVFVGLHVDSTIF